MSEKRLITERTCCACRKKHMKAQMMAVVRLKDGLLVVDAAGKTYGRSAYLCRNKSCLDRAKNRKGSDPISMSLKTSVSPAIWDELAMLIIKD